MKNPILLGVVAVAGLLCPLRVSRSDRRGREPVWCARVRKRGSVVGYEWRAFQECLRAVIVERYRRVRRGDDVAVLAR